MRALRFLGRAFGAVMDWPLTLGGLLLGAGASAGRGRRVLFPLACIAALGLLVFFVTWALSPVE